MVTAHGNETKRPQTAALLRVYVQESNGFIRFVVERRGMAISTATSLDNETRRILELLTIHSRRRHHHCTAEHLPLFGRRLSSKGALRASFRFLGS